MEYGKAGIEVNWMFEPNSNDNPTEWEMYQFEDENDNSEDRAFWALVSLCDDGRWHAEIEGAYWSEDWLPKERKAMFDDAYEAMEWCCSWSFDPELGQGTHSSDYLEANGEMDD